MERPWKHVNTLHTHTHTCHSGDPTLVTVEVMNPSRNATWSGWVSSKCRTLGYRSRLLVVDPAVGVWEQLYSVFCGSVVSDRMSFISDNSSRDKFGVPGLSPCWFCWGFSLTGPGPGPGRGLVTESHQLSVGHLVVIVVFCIVSSVSLSMSAEMLSVPSKVPGFCFPWTPKIQCCCCV